MFKKFSKNFHQFQNRFFRISDSYIRYCRQPLNEKLILLEAGQGKNINGNVFALLRELCRDPHWKDLTLFFTVRTEKQKEAQKRFEFYQLPVKTVLHNSKEYCKILATAKYLITDNSFPAYFNKREGQIYLNTWHGTSFKTLGKSDIQNAKSLANIQKNYLMTDYALFANHFAEQVFMEDHMLNHLYQGKILFCDQPRNSVFFDETHMSSLRRKLNLENKQLIAYLPTWRGSGRTANVDAQKDILHKYLMQIDQQLREDQVFFVNLHFLLNSSLDFSQYQHIRTFPEEYETYDFLSICDILVTDYSSVFYDFAVTRRKIILFLYDLEQFMRERGTYFPIEELPFSAVYDPDSLIQEINTDTDTETSPALEKFRERFCPYCAADTPAKILRLIIEGNEDGLYLEHLSQNSQKLILVYGGLLKNPHLNRCLLEYLHTLCSNPDYQVVLCFSGTVNANTVQFLSQLPDSAAYLALATKTAFSFFTRMKVALSLRNKYLALNSGKNLEHCFQQEKQRIFYQLNPWKVIYFPNTANYMYRIISCFSCKKEAHMHHPYLVGQEKQHKMYQIMIEYFQKYYSSVCDHSTDNPEHLWPDEEHDTFYNKMFEAGNLLKYFHNNQNQMSLYAVALIKSSLPFPLEKLQIQIQNRRYPAHIKKRFPIGKSRQLISYSFSIPVQDFRYLRSDNGVQFSYTDEHGYGLKKTIKYHGFSTQGKGKQSPLRHDPSWDISACFCQSKHNYLRYKVRAQSISDFRIQRLKICVAYYFSKFCSGTDAILLYEKNGSSYEDSTSILFEKLIDENYFNIWYVIDRHCRQLDSIPEKYQTHLIYRGSWKHYVHFFRSKTFIGTESLLHAVDCKSENKYIHKKINSQNFHFIFLQNGVSCAFTPAVIEHRIYKAPKTNGTYRLVCSSPAEAERFQEFNKHLPSQIYCCGLPKFDHLLPNPSAEHVVICLVLKPWEEIPALTDFASSEYYHLIERIFYGIPEDYREKTKILLDSCVADAAASTDFVLKKYTVFQQTPKEVLQNTRLLITDYSSISCEAFYCGANVIFYWEKLADTLKQYSSKTTFFFNEENIFGELCRNQRELQETIPAAYHSLQTEENLRRFRYFVSFDDGQNTQRLLSVLKKDHLLSS